MRTIYIDSNFKCYISNDGAITAMKTDFFNSKYGTFVEGYQHIFL